MPRTSTGLGFEDVGSIPGPAGQPVMTILQREGVMLIADALVGMPFPDSERERQIQAGPRGLGVAIGLGVDDLDSAYQYCRAAGCEITSEPTDEPWGDRVFECVDPFGYVWEFSQPIPGEPPSDGFAATHDAWFRDNAT
jgi:catechol 2,3-dioxygenase-like lactoylglutathione lyase family enzyme